MTIWAVGSLAGAPGATSVAVGLGASWPAGNGRSRVVIEANPDGGVLAARFDDLRADRTVADVAVALRREFDPATLLALARNLWGSLPVIPGHPSADQSTSVLLNAGDRLATALASATDLDAIVDVGRLTARSPAVPLAHRAAAVLLVARTRFEDVAMLTCRVRELRSVGVEPCLVAVGSRPYEPTTVAGEAGLPLLAVLPDDPASAAVLAGEGRADGRLRRSLLWRMLCDISSRLPGYEAPPVNPSAAAATATPDTRPPSWPDRVEVAGS